MTAQFLDEVTVKYPKAEKNVMVVSDHTYRQVSEEGWGGKASRGRNESEEEQEEVKGMSLGGGS